MRFITLLLLCLFMTFSIPLSYAQDNANASGDSVTVDKENVSDLIDKLENEEKREEFIEDLKTLVEADEQVEEENSSLPGIADSLGVNAQASKWVDSYQQFLKKNNLNSSIMGKSIITFIALLVLVIVLVVIHKLGIVLRNRVLEISKDFGLTHGRFRLYARIVRYIGYFLAVTLFIYTVATIWKIYSFNFFKGESFTAFLGDFIGLSLIVVVAIGIWEVINSYLENMIHSAGRQERNRLRTLLPIIRNVIFIAFAILFTLVILSELGIDIVPLLAGAGILGIAIGFGAQTMVKDFLTGFTIILEDLIQVGDVASLGGKIGLIEKITIRKVQLRDLSGIVYTVPFSDIGIVENWTKDFSYYVMDIGVAYRENTDEVIKLLKEVDKDMRGDENFEKLILEPLEILGVDAFADSAVIIKARIKTKPIRQWDVGREFNRRMKIIFDENNVEIPFPHQTIYFGEDKEGKAPPAQILLQESENKTKKTTKKTKAKKTDKK